MDEGEVDAIAGSITSVLDDLCDSLSVHGYIDGKNSLDRTLWDQAQELGWLMIALPEASGGLGLGGRGSAILHRALGQAAAPGPFLATAVALEVLTHAASDSATALVDKVLTGSASLAIQAVLSDTGKPELRLLGDADAAAVLMVGEGGDMVVYELAGLAPTALPMWDETRSMLTVTAPTGSPTFVLPGTRAIFERAYALALAADSGGVAKGAFDRTLVYMKEREQFGRPIGSFQALKHRAANLALKTLAAENMVEQAASQADGPADRDIWARIGKAEVTEIATFVTGDCLQLFGGVGFTREYDPHIYLKRARLNEMLLDRNARLRDLAADALAAASDSGADFMEIVR